MLPLQGAHATAEWRRQGASSGKVPGSLSGWLGQGLRWERGSNPSFLSRPILSLHSSSQAAIGLLLHDCLLHGVPETLLPAAIFKIPPAQPRSLPPRRECSSLHRSLPDAPSKQAGAHGQSRTHPQGGAPCPSEPSEAQALAHLLEPLVLVQPHRLWLMLGSGMPAVPRWMSRYMQTHLVDLGTPDCVLCCQNLAAPPPHPTLTHPSLLHQSLLPLGWADSWASACGSPGYKRQARD